VQRVAAMLQEAKREGTTVLLVEQNLRFATTVADRHYLLAQGQIVEALANQEVIARESELLRHLGV
jgi:branched-chain amino acid transport system ATP-binding protein